VLTVAEAFAHHCGIDLMATIDDPHAPAASPRHARLRAWASAPPMTTIGMRSSSSLSRWRGSSRSSAIPAPTLLCDYPIHMAALSRPKADAIRTSPSASSSMSPASSSPMPSAS
jgi:elongation factor P--beta-lysine ligase